MAQRLAAIGRASVDASWPDMVVLLSELPERTPATYTSRDGRRIIAQHADIQVADWLLENRLHACFGGPTEACEHWDDAEFTVPPGRPPFGDGFVALGEAKTWRRARETSLDALRRRPCRRADLAEPWRPCADPLVWLEHIGQHQRHDRLFEGPKHYKYEFQDPAEFATLLERQRQAVQQEYASLFRVIAALLQIERPRLYVGAHALWDRYLEDWLARDHVALAAGGQACVLIFRFIDRYYG